MFKIQFPIKLEKFSGHPQKLSQKLCAKIASFDIIYNIDYLFKFKIVKCIQAVKYGDLEYSAQNFSSTVLFSSKFNLISNDSFEQFICSKVFRKIKQVIYNILLRTSLQPFYFLQHLIFVQCIFRKIQVGAIVANFRNVVIVTCMPSYYIFQLKFRFACQKNKISNTYPTYTCNLVYS